jgi:cell division septum initiation protein DivIVA
LVLAVRLANPAPRRLSALLEEADMPGRFSPAAAQRARDLDRALDQDRVGRDRNRNAADKQIPDPTGDQRLNHPNVNNRRVGR